MQNLPQPARTSSSALINVGLCLLVPVAGLVLLPILLLFVLVFYFLAVFQGGRVLFFTWSSQEAPLEPGYARPHFIEAPAKEIPAPDPSPPKG